MELASIRPGDIVRVDKKGRGFEAFVLKKHKGGLEIEPIQRGVSYTSVSAREVVCHWAQRGRRRGAGPPRAGEASR